MGFHHIQFLEKNPKSKGNCRETDLATERTQDTVLKLMLLLTNDR